ncbi:MAG: hypothetical protein KC619_25340 [Myxococcales bacterium]|nr:hypothetical protein [Myxococcales bacterium]
MTREAAGRVEKDRVVAVALELTADDGEVLDSSSAQAPLVYLHGREALPKALEDALAGREVGERFEKDLAPEELVGPKRADTDRALPIDAFSPHSIPAVGSEVTIEEGERSSSVWVVAVGTHHVRVSLDHPWAGRSVKLTAEVLKIRPATPGELARGAPDGVDPREDETLEEEAKREEE